MNHPPLLLRVLSALSALVRRPSPLRAVAASARQRAHSARWRRPRREG